MSFEASPAAKKRYRKRRQREQAQWAKQSGPVEFQRITREQAFTVPCPTCQADAGAPCTGKRVDERVAPHAGRYWQYRQQHP